MKSYKTKKRIRRPKEVVSIPDGEIEENTKG